MNRETGVTKSKTYRLDIARLQEIDRLKQIFKAQKITASNTDLVSWAIQDFAEKHDCVVEKCLYNLQTRYDQIKCRAFQSKWRNGIKCVGCEQYKPRSSV